MKPICSAVLLAPLVWPAQAEAAAPKARCESTLGLFAQPGRCRQGLHRRFRGTGRHDAVVVHRSGWKARGDGQRSPAEVTPSSLTSLMLRASPLPEQGEG